MQANTLFCQTKMRLSRLLIGCAAPAMISVFAAGAVFCLVVWTSGYDPLVSVIVTFQGAFGSSFAIRETLSNSIPILLCALAVAIPARVGAFNLGGEGQLHCGAIAATAIALQATDIPRGLALMAMVLAAGIAGALWAALAGLLKAIWRINEILICLMLNYIAILAVEHLVHGPWKDSAALGWPYTAYFPPSAVLPTWGATNVHLGLLVGIVAALILGMLYRRTSFGLSMRLIDASPAVARYAGVPAGLYLVMLMALGGVFAAWSGVGEVSVIQGRLRPGISPGYGYTGFLVSWLVGHRFIAIIPAAVFAGGLYSGADELQLTAGLPSSSADILLGLLFVAALIGVHLRHRFLARIEPRLFSLEDR